MNKYVLRVGASEEVVSDLLCDQGLKTEWRPF